MPISILNYGMANLRSVQKAFEAIGEPARIVTTAHEIELADGLVLPGVGAVGDALAHLRTSGLDQAILKHIDAGKPFLGICLGLQMLMDVCHEGGEHRGLSVVAGDCVRFSNDRGPGLKIPHMGWNQLEIRHPSPLFADLPGDSVYFVHSYHVRPANPSVVAATSDYGGAFVSAICKDNVMAVQFHPEKSQTVGLKMLKNFAAL